MKAKPKQDLVEGQEVDANGHEDNVVYSMLHDRVMVLEPYQDGDGNIISEWFVENLSQHTGYNWHISWLDVIEE